ncbi:YgfZ/GcvT domain-containing protein [Algirhabdus cladophorae]|uniref:CAF17-like 4Fe-4S cluster assembly/insertion protein YgfZ n=1 Tax=Algirhabdus cladophorae TaxID=3377108 RepID=UPI003B849793
MTNTRKLFDIQGTDRVSFLQGLVTNDVREGLVYAALLTPQGKYLADFFLLGTDERILLDIDASIADQTVQRLSMYKLRADVTIEPSEMKVQRGLGEAPDGAIADPRNDALGWRYYAPDAGPDHEIDWTALHVAHCVPQTGIELTPDSYILEAGFEQLSGVDFRKGCYVGQEVTARMKHKTELRKGLTKVKVTGAAPTGTPILSGSKEAGVLYSQAAGEGIAYLRFDRAKGEMTAQDATVHRIDPA